MGTFEIRDQFYLNGEPFKIISGSIHYFRVVPEYWRDRLEKLRAMGCNTVETYVAWNMHEPEKGRFSFEGMQDIARFLRTAQELGLYAIVRPSPYICAEWEFGGLPAWLLTDGEVRVRSREGRFLSHVASYYERLFSVIAPLQIGFGGPIILMQLENEYGAWGNDAGYLERLKKLMEASGLNVPLVTSDGPWRDDLECGSLPGVLPTANFGSKAKEQLAVLKKHTGNGPLMCMEFWVGWFDYWGCGAHNRREPDEIARDLDDILSQGSVNIYMFHGGTSFGFTSGANDYGCLTPDVTSYDYDAPLTEDGRMTPKYAALRSVIAKYAPVPEAPLTAKISRAAYGTLAVRDAVSLFAALDDISAPESSLQPVPMEKLSQPYGYVLYRTVVNTGDAIEKFRLTETGDRAQVFVDQRPVLTLFDRELWKEHAVSWPHAKGASLDILAENLGRVNFGVTMAKQAKGIAGSVALNSHIHSGWTQYPLPLCARDIGRLDFSKSYEDGLPAFYRFRFDARETGDTFLDMSGWGKGCAFINGFNLGRFWDIGPQKRLYVPAPLLRRCANELIIFETEGKAGGTVTLCDTPDIG